MRDLSRKHHYLPQFYLAGFTDSQAKDGTLHVFDKEQCKQWETTPAATAWERDLYMLEAGDEKVDLLEKLNADYEALVAPILAQVRANCTLPDGDAMGILIGFVAMMEVRVPTFRDSLNHNMANLANAMVRTHLATRERWQETLQAMKAAGYVAPEVGYEEMLDFVERGDYELTVHQNFYLEMVGTSWYTMTQILANRHWSRLSTGSDTEFVCSDSPLSIIWLHDDHPRWAQPGFGLGGTEVVLPISSSVALASRFEDDLPESLEVDRANVARINSRTIKAPARFIYSRLAQFSWFLRQGIVGGPEELVRHLQARR